MPKIISFLKRKMSKFFSCFTSPDGSSSRIPPAPSPIEEASLPPPSRPTGEGKGDPSPIEEGGFPSEIGAPLRASPSRPIEEGEGDPSTIEEGRGDPSPIIEEGGFPSEIGAPLLTPSRPIEEGKGDPSEKGGSVRAPSKGDGSSSSSVSKVSDLTTTIKEAIDGKEGNVNLDELINHISQLLEVLKGKSSKKKLNFSTQKFWARTTSRDFLNLKEFFTGVKDFASAVKDIIPSQGSSAAKTVVVDLLKGIGHASLPTAGLLIFATILERFEHVSDIEGECLSLLDEMNSLAKHVKELQDEPWLNEEMEGPIRKATELILEACIMCCSQIDSSRFSKFFLTSVNKQDLLASREELRKMYRVMDNRMSLCLFRANKPRRLKPVHIEYPTNAVGIEDPLDKVIELLDWQSEKKAIAVVIHGFGGMGKTTLANAVYATLFDQNNIKGCKFAMVRLFENIATTPDVKKLQNDIIKDLRTGTEKDKDAMPNIRTFEQGQQEIGLLLKEEVAFIFVDNVLLPDKVEQGRDALEQLLPQNMGIAKKLRLLITARDSNAVGVREEHGIQTKFYAIESLVDEKAKDLFKQKLGDKENQIDSNQMNEIVKACGGIPKLLTVVAGFISCEENAQNAYRTVMKESKKNWKGEIGERIDRYVFVYDNLENSLRDPFLDICSFFQGWDWEALSNIVGEQELKKLEKRALVTKDVKSMTARVHDVILKIGLQKTDGERFRFTSSSEIQEFLDQKEDADLQKIKGIWSSENRDPLGLPASKLDLMYKSLRVLTLGPSTYVEGRCKKIFEKLVFFSAQISHLPFDLSKLKYFEELRHLCFKPADLQNLSQMPSNLLHIDLQLNSPSFQISSNCIQQLSNLQVLKLRNAQLKRLPHDLGDVVNGLRELTLSDCQYLEELPETISTLRSLRVLRINYCSGLRQLPKDFGSLNSDLQELDLGDCESLEALPSSLGKLTSLQRLDLGWCKSLKALPSNLGDLISLQELRLSSCTSLEALPTSLEELSSLRILSLFGCTSLKNLPYGLGKLTSLVDLRLHGCTKLRSIPDSIGQLKLLDSIDLTEVNLKELPDEFCNLSFITELTIDGCHRLEKLPDRFGEAKSLINLSLCNCKNLKKLPESFSQLKYLEKLDLSKCTSLEELCTDFKCLSSLRVLSLEGCNVLKKLPESFSQLKCLEELDLSGCTSLEELCTDFKCLSSLRDLSLKGCNVLKKLPESFSQLKCLEVLDLSECTSLEELCADFKCLSSLRVLSLEGCNVLKKLPESFSQLKCLEELKLSGCTSLEELCTDFKCLSSLRDLSLKGCNVLKKLPESFSQLKCLEVLDLSECTSLEELCADFKCLSSLRVLSLEQCNVLKKLPESFSQLKCLEELKLSGCTSLEELCTDFKGVSSLRVLSLKNCEVLKKLPEDFHLLTSLEILDLTDCHMLEGKWMESMVKMKTLQILYISGSTLLEERWEEIQSQCHQSWSCAVHTRQGLSNKENILKQLQSEFDCLLINGREEPVHMSDLPLNTPLLVLFDGRGRFYDIFLLSLIEESIDDIQTNFVLVYFGKQFDKFPKKVANKILGHAPANANAQTLFRKLFIAAEKQKSDWLLNAGFQMAAKVVNDEKGNKYLSDWELLRSAEGFVAQNCGRYIKLKQLVESPRENHIELLRELFASGEEESSLVFLKKGASTKVGVDELKRKKILLDIRPSSICYDIPLLSLVEMYLAVKDRFNFEIITIPIVEAGTPLDVSKFSTEVPWLVLQDPRQLMNATKYFLVEACTEHLREGYGTWSWNTWHPNIMRIIESNGTMAAHDPTGLLRMVNAWGTEAYPFTEEKYKKLMEKEVEEMKEMPDLVFLFNHLESVSEKVKWAMRQQKMICLCTSDDREFTNSIKNGLMEWSDSIYIIYIPKFEFSWKEIRKFSFTGSIHGNYLPWKSWEMLPAEMPGMSVLNLSEHDVMRFWARISLLKEAMVKIQDKDEELSKIYSLLDFIYPRIEKRSNLWMVIMDEDGNLITKKGKQIVKLLCEENQNDRAKELMQQLIKGTKESRKEILGELEGLLNCDEIVG